MPEDVSGRSPQDKIIEPIRYALNELLENALTHSRRHGYVHANVWVACQYYPKADTAVLAVADNGCGIWETLKNQKNLGLNSHLDAIKASLLEKVSCNREVALGFADSVNEGLGLTTTRRIADGTKGRLIIVSGDAVYRSDEESGNYLDDGGLWQGVAVSVELKRDLLSSVDFRKYFPRDNQDIPGIQFE